MKRVLAVLLILCLLATGALAKNILPSLDEITTDVLPSMSNALLRNPSETETYPNGDQRQLYENISQEEYARCGEYLGDQGCEAKSNRTNPKERTMTVELSHGDHSFTMRYDARNRTLEMTYPKGTAPATDELFRPGSSVFFGHYEGSLIEWGVLANDGEAATLISMRALDAQPYHNAFVRVGYENSALRYYLNTSFSGTAFSAEERNRLVPDEAGDVVRLLSAAEAAALFADGAARKCSAADYVAELAQSEDACRWWLRGTDAGLNAPIVDEGGNILQSGDDVTRVIGVRPMVVFNVADIETAGGDYGAISSFAQTAAKATNVPKTSAESKVTDKGRLNAAYAAAIDLFISGEYAAAEEAFLALDDYEKSAEYAARAGALKPTPSPEEIAAAQKEHENEEKYKTATLLFAQGRYAEAEEKFRELGDYRDSRLQADNAAILKPTPTPTAKPTPTPTPKPTPTPTPQMREFEYKVFDTFHDLIQSGYPTMESFTLNSPRIEFVFDCALPAGTEVRLYHDGPSGAISSEYCKLDSPCNIIAFNLPNGLKKDDYINLSFEIKTDRPIGKLRFDRSDMEFNKAKYEWVKRAGEDSFSKNALTLESDRSLLRYLNISTSIDTDFLYLEVRRIHIEKPFAPNATINVKCADGKFHEETIQEILMEVDVDGEVDEVRIKLYERTDESLYASAGDDLSEYQKYLNDNMPCWYGDGRRLLPKY